MRTTIVSGLLGSGKTTFIKNYVRGRNESAVVLVNEFGQSGIDGDIFTADAIESVELPSGCVCCTLKVDLITTVKNIIRKHSPQHLLIEPSGVASPSAVLEAIASAGVDVATVVGIIDVTEFSELYASGIYGSFFEDQIVNADVILVNKTDLAAEEMIVDAINHIESINPRILLFRAIQAEFQWSLPQISEQRKSRQTNHSRFHFDSLSMNMPSGIKLSYLREHMDKIAGGQYGTVVRAKALVQTDEGPFRFDVVFGRVNCTRFSQAVPNSRMLAKMPCR